MEPPEILGPYRIESEIGRGGMGAVYRAYDARLDRSVAIKRVRISERRGASEQRRRFLREARATARLSHPAIVPVHDLLRHGDEDWIVMELVEGASLAELIRQAPLPIPRVLELGRQIAEGLAHAHQNGTIHRDLKLENVMVTADGRAKILDFGLAKRLSQDGGGESEDDLTAAGAIFGTCRAMSPEQARGLELDPRSDLFAFGVLLYEMATGVRPFEGQTPVDTLAMVCCHEPSPIETWVETPRGLSRLISELLRKEAARRPESAEEVAQSLAALESWKGEDPPETAPNPIEVETTRVAEPADGFPSAASGPNPLWGDRHRALRWTGGILALGVAAVLTLAWSSGRLSRLPPNPSSPHESQQSVHDLLRRGAALLASYYRTEDLEDAILAFERAIARQPDSAAAYAGLSRALWRRYYAENRDSLWLERALSHGRRAVELDPYLSDARVSLALALIYLDRIDEAEAAIDGALTLDPSSADLHRVQAEILRFHGRFEEAEQATRLAIEARSDDFDLHDLLGSLQARGGRLEAAADTFRHSIELAPESIVAYRNLAGMYYRRGERAEAARWLQKALEVRPESTLYASLGILYFDQGLYHEATRVFEAAVEFPGGGNDFRVWANLADAYRWTPDHQDQARHAYGRAIELLHETGRRDARDRSRVALWLAKRGDRDEARKELEALASMESEETATPYRAAVAWEILGERALALEALAEALQAGYPVDSARRDPELTELRANADFHRLIGELQDP